VNSSSRNLQSGKELCSTVTSGILGGSNFNSSKYAAEFKSS